jgi:hypothetical protein
MLPLEPPLHLRPLPVRLLLPDRTNLLTGIDAVAAASAIGRPTALTIARNAWRRGELQSMQDQEGQPLLPSTPGASWSPDRFPLFPGRNTGRGADVIDRATVDVAELQRLVVATWPARHPPQRVPHEMLARTTDWGWPLEALDAAADVLCRVPVPVSRAVAMDLLTAEVALHRVPIGEHVDGAVLDLALDVDEMVNAQLDGGPFTALPGCSLGSVLLAGNPRDTALAAIRWERNPVYGLRSVVTRRYRSIVFHLPTIRHVMAELVAGRSAIGPASPPGNCWYRWNLVLRQLTPSAA